MIGYKITYKDLETLIEAKVPGWVARAKKRTANFRAAGKYDEVSSIWSEVKSVYMRLQGESKCIYCERKLESEEYGLIEQDVEHFRPKGSVRRWKLSARLVAEGVTITDPGASAPGYHLLPYHLFNYSASCKPCNSTLKSDCFPIAGTYKFAGSNPTKLASEQPLLIYPLGDFDADPEALIKFQGVSPQPVDANGHNRHRALVTIEFFDLADPIKRKNLFRERAQVITALWPQLEAVSRNPGDALASDLVADYQSDKAPHTNCARSFATLYHQDRPEAERLYRAAATFIRSSS
ncbi:HNH endonuclease family protein [Burkholderia paludis]|uniref:hypothetical protein n=1 Tax=Burkholderia paludis TaxID=1506587 RepID=UPI00068E72C6|nr:hypothetical protein [Burkholderia paludis]